MNGWPGVQVNTTLERLELNSNAIDESGVTALAEALVENKTLTALALRYVSIHHKPSI